MKYIFIVLWEVLVILWTLIEVCILYTFCLIWYLRIPKNLWKRLHTAEYAFQNRCGGYSFIDSNIYYTIKRRILYTFTDVDMDTIIIDCKPYKKKDIGINDFPVM